MAFGTFHLFSPAMGKRTTVNAVWPDSLAGKPFHVMFLLHGMSDDHTAWCRWTSIERYAADLPLVIVMPDGLRGFYTDARQGYAVETYIFRELVEFVEGFFPTRKPWCATGLSMGGYGALKLALRLPGRFVSAASHSGAVMMGHRPPAPVRAEEMRLVFGPRPTGGKDDLLALARRRLNQRLRPALRLDCGTEDFLLEDNRDFVRELAAMGYPHEYAEHPGAHDWAYWDAHVRDSLDFHRRTLGF